MAFPLWGERVKLGGMGKRLSGDGCCITDKKDRKGEDRNRPFKHQRNSASLKTKITHQISKCKRFSFLNLDTYCLKLYFLMGWAGP